MNWIMSETDLAPQVIWIAIGVNDCRNRKNPRDAADNIIEAVRAAKYWSPQSVVIVQGVLPTSYPEDDPDNFEGEKWSDQDMYDCVESINNRVKDFVDDNDDMCIEYADLEDVVLTKGKFRDNVLGDGLHFLGGGDMGRYCEAIADEVERFGDYDVQSRSESPLWRDVEPFAFEGDGEPYYRWAYSEWTQCTGDCGNQRRTVQCLLHDPMGINSTDELVKDEMCGEIFLNPLERICNFTTECLANLTMPPQALVVQPYTAVVRPQPSPGPQRLGLGCSKASVAQIVMLAAIAVLAVLLVALVIYTVRLHRQIKGPAEAPSKVDNSAEETKEVAADSI